MCAWLVSALYAIKQGLHEARLEGLDLSLGLGLGVGSRFHELCVGSVDLDPQHTQHYRGNELVSVESESDSDSETEPTQIIDRSPLYMSIAKLASKASFRGNDGAREWLKAIMGLPEDHVLPPVR